jgi:sigma-B regulation protein RsbU (phosphoserine phosphatase)
VTDPLNPESRPSESAVLMAELKSEHQLLTTLFALGREVAAMLDLDELYAKLPELIARIVRFHAFAVYLVDERRGDLYIAHASGYPDQARSLRLKMGAGLVGAAVAAGRSLIVDDVRNDERYVEAVPGTRAELVVPLGRTIGALNLLGRNAGEFAAADLETLLNFASVVAVAIENARLFETAVRNSESLEILAEIGRDMTSILDLGELLKRIAHLLKRLVDYRTFGILLLDRATGELEMKHAVRYDEEIPVKRLKLGEGLVGHAAQVKAPILVADVTTDPRYIKVVEDVRSELVIPLLVKDRCIGVFDLESPEIGAFTKAHIDLLTPLASHAAIAIENARLYEEIRSNEARLEKELRFAQRVQAALLPTELPKRLKGVDAAWRFEPARELGGDLYDFFALESQTLTVAVGDVSGKGVPAALYSAFAGELLRSRAFRRRYTNVLSSPGGVLASMNAILHERQLFEYYCTLCYAQFDFRRRTVVLANSGLPYPVRCHEAECAQVAIAGVPLGSFPGVTYDEVALELCVGDAYVFCTDGILEAMDHESREFGAERLLETVRQTRHLSAKAIVAAIFYAVGAFCGDTPPNDDRTAVVVKLTGGAKG